MGECHFSERTPIDEVPAGAPVASLDFDLSAVSRIDLSSGERNMVKSFLLFINRAFTVHVVLFERILPARLPGGLPCSSGLN